MFAIKIKKTLENAKKYYLNISYFIIPETFIDIVYRGIVIGWSQRHNTLHDTFLNIMKLFFDIMKFLDPLRIFTIVQISLRVLSLIFIYFVIKTGIIYLKHNILRCFLTYEYNR